MIDLKLLTTEQIDNLKPGDKIIRVKGGNFGDIERGRVYTFEKVNGSFGAVLKDSSWKPDLRKFALADDKSVARILTVIANKGRDAADELLNQYSNLLVVENGRYKIK